MIMTCNQQSYTWSLHTWLALLAFIFNLAAFCVSVDQCHKDRAEFDWLKCSGDGHLAIWSYPVRRLVLGGDSHVRLYVNDTSNATALTHSATPRLIITAPFGFELVGFRVLQGNVDCNSTWYDEGLLVSCEQIDSAEPLLKAIEFKLIITDPSILPNPVLIAVQRRHSKPNNFVSEYNNDVLQIELQLEYDSRILLFASVYPEQQNVGLSQLYNGTSSVQHVYHVQKFGSTPMKSLQLDVYVPQYVHGPITVYTLIDQPNILNQQKLVQCEILNRSLNQTDLLNWALQSDRSGQRQGWPFTSRLSKTESAMRQVISDVTRSHKVLSVKDNSGMFSSSNMDCAIMHCAHVQCRISSLQSGHSVRVVVPVRMFAEELAPNGVHFNYRLGTFAVLEPIEYIRPTNITATTVATATVFNLSVSSGASTFNQVDEPVTAVVKWPACVLLLFVLISLLTLIIYCKYKYDLPAALLFRRPHIACEYKIRLKIRNVKEPIQSFKEPFQFLH